MPEGITSADDNAAALGPLSCLATITSRVSSLSSSNCLVGFQSLLSVISLRFGIGGSDTAQEGIWNWVTGP